MLRFLLFVFFVALAFLFFILASENLDLVSLNLLTLTMDIPLSLLLLLSFISGALIGILFCASLVFKNRSKARMLAKKVALVEREVVNLRQLPIKSPH